MVYDALIMMVYGIGFATLAYFNTFVGFLSIIHSRGLPVYHSYIVYRWIYNWVTMWFAAEMWDTYRGLCQGAVLQIWRWSIRTTRRKNLHLGVRCKTGIIWHYMICSKKMVQHGITICFLTSGPVIHASRNTLIISDVLFVPFLIFHHSPGTNGWWHKPSFIQVLSHHGPLIDDLPVVSTIVIFHSYMN